MEPECSLPCSQEPANSEDLCNISKQAVFYGNELLAPRPAPSWRTTPLRLSATAYSVYSQLPSISGGLLELSHTT